VAFTGTPTFNFEINNATGTAGTSWSLLQVPNNNGNAIALPSTFNINLVSLDAGNNHANVPGFNSTTPYTWEFLRSSGGFSGFGSTTFVINDSQFLNSLDSGFGFSVIQVAPNALAITYAPVPEPGHILLLCAGVVVVGGYLRRRQQQTSRKRPLLEADSAGLHSSFQKE